MPDTPADDSNEAPQAAGELARGVPPASTVSVRPSVSPGREAPGPTRVVKLELLRHGPDYNQLLSPLTPYLALCGNHDPETLHVGSEHLHMLRRLRLLRYEGGVDMATSTQREVAEEVTRLLGSIHSLTAELATSDPLEEQRMVHLRLVLSASELALLPFELANAFAGLSGQGQPLCLQTVSPVCITREVRRVAATTLEWPRKVRILVVSAAPPPLSPVPLREHLAALRAALGPYMVQGDDEEFHRFVTVVPEASLSAIRQVCRDSTGEPYTHVHLLAHGISTEGLEGASPRYGIALHDGDNPNEADIVTGARLVAALRCHLPGRKKQELACPAVLTLASCDSANMGSVLVPSGGSVAHELHEAGIPLVIGSQFPLSVKGSVVMARLLYRRLLRGDDPRKVIHDLRQALIAEVPEAPNDWASIVAYAAFPADLPAQLVRVRFDRARLELDTAMARMDLSEQAPPPKTSEEERDRKATRQRLQLELMGTMKRLREATPTSGASEERVHALGVLASAGKQVAWFLGPTGTTPSTPPAVTALGAPRDDAPQEAPSQDFIHVLRVARSDYYACYQAGNIDSWPLVQYLALTVALDKNWYTDEFKERWTAAVVMSRDALRSENTQRRVWALCALVELQVLSAAWAAWEDCWERSQEYIDQLFKIIDLEPYKDARFDAYSLYRQVRRYFLWSWGTPEMRELATWVGADLDERGALAHWVRTS